MSNFPPSASRPINTANVVRAPDWEIERPTRFWDPPRKLIASARAYTRAKQAGSIWGYLLSKLAVLRHRFWSVVTSAELPIFCSNIGGGLVLPHPNGIIIHPDTIVGPNCRIFQQVTMGTGSRPGLPVIGAHVDIGAGAKILGGVKIGDFAIIGANAVVISDVPAGATAVGVPAVIKTNAQGQWDFEVRSSRGSAIPLSTYASSLASNGDETS
jgi:serine O-acetyltransferase